MRDTTDYIALFIKGKGLDFHGSYLPYTPPPKKNLLLWISSPPQIIMVDPNSWHFWQLSEKGIEDRGMFGLSCLFTWVLVLYSWCCCFMFVRSEVSVWKTGVWGQCMLCRALTLADLSHPYPVTLLLYTTQKASLTPFVLPSQATVDLTSAQCVI